jgi:2-polyprenyl-3-methyl-5-hydroxy-6-metoxy-1,4-benzoquinol methylase
MANDDQVRWDRQHAVSHGSDQASRFLKEVLLSGSWPIPRGRALDIATGKGRNAIFLAEQGFDVVAIDVSPVALDEAGKRAAEKSLSISWQQADLEQIELPKTTYDLIVNFNYLQRSLIPQIKTALVPGGHVIFETHLIGQEVVGHPKNPAYLLRHNELLELFRDFRVLCYREGEFAHDGEASFRAGLLAQKVG